MHYHVIVEEGNPKVSAGIRCDGKSWSTPELALLGFERECNNHVARLELLSRKARLALTKIHNEPVG